MSIRQVKPAAIVHVGSYQYFSNKLFYHSNWHIQNPFNIQSDNVLKELPSSGSPIRIIYLGALLRVKGFGHLVRHWKRLKLSIPNIELHVIGSSATYGKKPKHELIPCDRNFAEEVLSFIPVEDIKSGSVVFHGNLGEEKFELMRSAHLAILNPTGASEAFPASPLECMGCGLPVIASGDYGMSDSMRFFPELTLQNPDQIPSLVAWLLSDRYRYMELSARAIAVSGWFDSQTDVVLVRWRQLFDLVNSQVEGKILNNNPPIESFYGSMYKLRQRQLKALAGSAKRFFLESS